MSGQCRLLPELAIAGSAALSAHVARCPHCAGLWNCAGPGSGRAAECRQAGLAAAAGPGGVLGKGAVWLVAGLAAVTLLPILSMPAGWGLPHLLHRPLAWNHRGVAPPRALVVGGSAPSSVPSQQDGRPVLSSPLLDPATGLSGTVATVGSGQAPEGANPVDPPGAFGLSGPTRPGRAGAPVVTAVPVSGTVTGWPVGIEVLPVQSVAGLVGVDPVIIGAPNPPPLQDSAARPGPPDPGAPQAGPGPDSQAPGSDSQTAGPSESPDMEPPPEAMAAADKMAEPEAVEQEAAATDPAPAGPSAEDPAKASVH